MITDVGPVETQVPRDRNATFELVTVLKHARHLDELTGQVVAEPALHP